ncbi:hypothetical protein CGLO_10122 [Colletotrichum gloeosporioides Cg-14]|uniref:Uncharacterized protein n=1 Tax=Colletotrichum gloeosporioides (strain Cg-14) TaxID=1237896 RepID=T0LQH3_COLGC|nr:hypothetical protein CGLO_10122 [Colletotrichum gloeosporioides Cg-14]
MERTEFVADDRRESEKVLQTALGAADEAVAIALPSKTWLADASRSGAGLGWTRTTPVAGDGRCSALSSAVFRCDGQRHPIFYREDALVG